MAYQSLYRRYRSGTFGELVGQTHVVTALRNAIVEERVGHAYLFSGPRGTGKTSLARILGKALNCTDLGADGEPCNACESCLAFAAGTSYDLHELDAASNNGVEAIRDLISKVSLGSPGRTKVYILDEVHMLTAGAENALLKTLEEPPPHVVFVLATTEPHKVVPTIRSRTQHFEFELLPAEDLERHVRWIVQDAALDVDDTMIKHVMRVGGGSARDTLSALDQVVAAGGVPRDDDVIVSVLAGLASTDSAAVIAAVSEALTAGRDPRFIGESVLGRLRDSFLSSMGAPVPHLSDVQAVEAAAVANEMGAAAITRALEVLGTCLIDMRQAPDPRVDLEVALLRLTRADLDTDPAAMLARIERLESGAVQGGGAAVAQPAAPSTAPPAAPPAAPAAVPEPPEEQAPQAPPAAGGTRPADQARAELARQRSGAPPPPSEVPVEPAVPQATLGATRGTAVPSDAASPNAAPPNAAPPNAAPPNAVPPNASAAEATPAEGAQEPPRAEAPVGDLAAASATSPGTVPTVEALTQAWDEVRPTLSGRAKSRFSGGRFVSADSAGVVFGLPNAIHRDRCLECVDDVAAALSAHFGTTVALTLVVDGDAAAPTPRSGQDRPAPPELAEEEAVDLTELIDAAPGEAGGVDLLTEAFPGAEIIDEAGG